MEIKPICALETEQSLLGCCLINGTGLTLEPGAFYSESHQLIARAIQALELSGTAPDLVTVAEHLSSKGQLETVGGAVYLAKVAEVSSGDPKNLEVYSRIIADYWLARKAQLESFAFVSGLDNRKGKPYSEIVAAHSQRMLEISDSRKRDDRETPIKASCQRFVGQLEERMDGAGMQGITTGWPDYDYLTGGLQPGQLVVIAARPSMGKTAIALNWMLNAARKGVSSLFFSLEMSSDMLTQRIISRMSRVATDRFRTGKLAPAEIERVYSAAARLAELPVLIVDCEVTDLDIASKARRHRKQIVLLDYLGLVTPAERNQNRAQELAGITRRLKLLAREMNVPVVVLAQLNREIEKENRAPRMSDLRDSGAIEQDADVILFVHVDRRENKHADHSSAERRIILAKQRDGDTGSWSMEFQREFQHFQRPEPARG